MTKTKRIKHRAVDSLFSSLHPGVLINDCIENQGISLRCAARELGVHHTTLRSLILGKTSVSTEMAVRLERWTGFISAKIWLEFQLDYDVSHMGDGPTVVSRNFAPNFQEEAKRKLVNKQ